MNPSPATSEAPAHKPARPTADPLAYTLSAASAACGLSRATLYRHAKAGRLRLLKVGGRTLVDAASLRALVGVAA